MNSRFHGIRNFVSIVLFLLAHAAAAFAAPPTVASFFPGHNFVDVGARVNEMRIVFDQDMDTTAGISICGGGETFPKVLGHEWKDARTLAVRVELKQEQTYEMTLNCPGSNRNFRNTAGELLPMTRWTFVTAGKPLSREEQQALNKKSYKQLGRLLREEYSYLDRRNVDLTALGRKYRDRLYDAARTVDWTNEVRGLLGEFRDPHIWFDYRGRRVGVFERTSYLNMSHSGVNKALPSIRIQNLYIYKARTEDNIGYLMIRTLDKQYASFIAEAETVLDELRDCRALLIDVRPNSGGDENLAKPIAAWFVEGDVVYAKHRFRDSKAEGGFGPVMERRIQGNAAPKRFDGPVAVLTGQYIMSSAEAFVLMLKQGKHVTVVGETTYGSSGNPQPHKLANGVTVYLPSWQAMRPDGTTFEGEGLRPDIEVKTEEYAIISGDPVIVAAMEHLRKQPGYFRR